MKNLILLFVFALGFTTTTIGQESLEDRYAEQFILLSEKLFKIMKQWFIFINLTHTIILYL